MTKEIRVGDKFKSAMPGTTATWTVEAIAEDGMASACESTDVVTLRSDVGPMMYCFGTTVAVLRDPKNKWEHLPAIRTGAADEAPVGSRWRIRLDSGDRLEGEGYFKVIAHLADGRVEIRFDDSVCNQVCPLSGVLRNIRVLDDAPADKAARPTPAEFFAPIDYVKHAIVTGHGSGLTINQPSSNLTIGSAGGIGTVKLNVGFDGRPVAAKASGGTIVEGIPDEMLRNALGTYWKCPAVYESLEPHIVPLDKCAPECTPANPCRREDVCPVWHEEEIGRDPNRKLRDARNVIAVHAEREEARAMRSQPYEPSTSGLGGGFVGIWSGKVGK